MAEQKNLFSITELSILLEINKAIVRTNNAKDLLAALRENVMQLIPFHDTGILIVDQNKEYHYDLAVNITGWDDSTGNQRLQEQSQSKKIDHRGSYVEFILDKLDAGEERVVIEDWESVIKKWDHPFFPLVKDLGYQQGMATLLKSGDTVLGGLWLNSVKKKQFSPKQFPLFLAIAEQVSVAVSNILGKEEILEREREQTILLSISEAIATIKDKNELFAIMVEKIRPLINFKASVSTIYSADFTEYCYYLFSGELGAESLPEELKSHLNVYLSMAGTSDEWVFQQGDVCSLTMEEKETVAHANPQAINILKAANITYSLYIKLKIGGKVIGVQHFHFEDRVVVTNKVISFAKSITDLIAMAVANVLANEEILKREQEKSHLLKISEAIATIKNYTELLKVVYEVVKPVFYFENTGIFIEDSENKQFIEITNEPVLSETVSPALIAMKIAEPLPLTTFMSGSWYFSKAPKVTTLKRELDLIQESVCKEQVKHNIELGLTQMICGPLITRGKKIGAIYLSARSTVSYVPNQLSLFKSVTDLISVAVANVIANEEIVEREKEKSLLLELSDAGLFIKDIAGLFQMMIQKIYSFSTFENAVLVLLSKDGKFYNGIIDGFDTTDTDYTSFNKLLPISIPVKDSPAKYLSALPDLYVWNLEDMEKKYPGDPYLMLMRNKGLLFSVHLKVNWNVNSPVGFLNFHFKNAGQIQKKHFGFYKSIAYQLATSIANIMAKDEITELNKQLAAQNAYLAEEVEQVYNFDEMVGQNDRFKEVFRNIGLVAKTDTTVLILGETGTGKELVARAIHNTSPRKNKPLIKLNCAALPANLIESELFGHERGAFTGAFEKRIGKFELANGSTLFLDEIGELPLELQSKLLRALQEKEVERLGSNKTIKIDLRIIAATNRDLEKDVQNGKFRQDLFYRLHIFPITLPPLRERKEDIPLLASHFIQRYSKKVGKNIKGMGNQALTEMMSYNWPGNIRELEHTIERCVILTNTKLIQNLDLPKTSKGKVSQVVNEFVVKTWEEQERDYILEVLRVTNGNVTGKGGAAELLQLPPTTLQSKMNKLGIKRTHFASKTSNPVYET